MFGYRATEFASALFVILLVVCCPACVGCNAGGAGQERQHEITATKLTIVDSKGHPIIVIGSDGQSDRTGITFLSDPENQAMFLGLARVAPDTDGSGSKAPESEIVSIMSLESPRGAGIANLYASQDGATLELRCGEHSAAIFTIGNDAIDISIDRKQEPQPPGSEMAKDPSVPSIRLSLSLEKLLLTVWVNGNVVKTIELDTLLH